MILACSTTKDEITRDPYKQACITLPHMTDDKMSCITSFAISVMIHAERGKVLWPNAGTVCISSSHKYQEYPQLLYCKRLVFPSENSSADTLLSRASFISSDVWRSGSIGPYIFELDTLWVVSEQLHILDIFVPKKEHLIHLG